MDDRTKRLIHGNTAPSVSIDRKGVLVDGQPLPLLVADAPITVTQVDRPNGVQAEINLTLLCFGPIAVDPRLEREKDGAQVTVTTSEATS